MLEQNFYNFVEWMNRDKIKYCKNVNELIGNVPKYANRHMYEIKNMNRHAVCVPSGLSIVGQETVPVVHAKIPFRVYILPTKYRIS